MAGLNSRLHFNETSPTKCLETFLKIQDVFENASMSVEFRYEPGHNSYIDIESPFTENDPVEDDLETAIESCRKRLDYVCLQLQHFGITG